MKRILFILLLIQGSLYAQHPVWPQPGAEWELCKTIPSVIAPTIYEVSPPIRYEKDTLIDNKTYQITRKLKTNGQIMIEFYTRFEQDTIFRYVNGNEYMFFTYNVAIGDTLFPLRTGTDDYNEDTCSVTLELLCLDISPININGNVLNLYEFTNVGNTEDNPFSFLKYYWVEIIGWVSHFPWLIISGEGYCNYFYEDGDFEFPIYYTDSTRSWPIEFQQHGHVCDTLLSLDQAHIENISIFPNPTSGKTTFSIGATPTNNSSIVITDLQGRTVKTLAITQKETQIDLELVVDGIYLVHLVESGVVRATKKLIYAR